MAAAAKVVSRLSSRLRPSAVNVNKKPPCPQLSPLQPASPTLDSISTRRFLRRSSRLPLKLSCVVGSMLPLHSAIASASLVSSLSSESDSWALVPQGLLVSASC